MSGFGTGARDGSSAQIVRTIGRLAGMLVELRDEYVARPRDDTMDQIEQRLDELIDLRESLRMARENEGQSVT
jgi:hypothetical protein